MKMLFVVIALAVCGLIWYTYQKSMALKANPEKTIGRITKIRSAYKDQDKRIIDYTFSVDGVEYKGSTRVPRFRKDLEEGRKVSVTYQKGKPENSTAKL
ncbi:MAG: hypothetical protein AB8B61_04285 [Cyclobacteriaceae bacterium]